jgi:hypothetical protein
VGRGARIPRDAGAGYAVEDEPMKGYEADAAIHEAVDYIKSWLDQVDVHGGTGQDLLHLLDILDGEYVPDEEDEE